MQFTLEMCVAASNHEKNSLKTPILGFKVIDVGTLISSFKRKLKTHFFLCALTMFDFY